MSNSPFIAWIDPDLFVHQEDFGLLLEIFKRTPPWVFALFLGLLALGYLQSRTRTVKRGQVAILPVVMTVLSVVGVTSAFGVNPLPLVAWALGSTAAVGMGLALGQPKGVRCINDGQSFVVPGSWVPLALMMGIFVTKYAVGVITGMKLPVVQTTAFAVGVSLAYGFFSGAFVSRTLVVLRSAQPTATERP